ncbi:MAG TPA: hypothetical protein VI357_19730 [Mycobacteriales bacterium]
MGVNSNDPLRRFLLQPQCGPAAPIDVFVESAPYFSLDQSLPNRVIGGGQQDGNHAGSSADRRYQFLDRADTVRIRVNESSIAEVEIVAPHQRKISLRQTVFPWRRVGHVEVVSLYDRVPGVHGCELY